jgi:hypothetical protein
MATTMTAEELRSAVNAAARVANTRERVIKSMKVGQVVQQGDLYIHRVEGTHPRGARRTGQHARQLAQGDQIGARHVAEPPAVVYDGVALPPWCDARVAIVGPRISSPARWRLGHPKHSAHSLPRGEYQVTHQLDVRTRRAVVE